MRMRLSRRSELFLPLALLIPTALGRAREALMLATAWALMRLCTLCGAEAFGRAAAAELSARRVRSAWTGALLTSVVLGVAAWAAAPRAYEALFSRPPDATRMTQWLCAGWALAVEKLCEERLRADGQRGSAAVCALLCAALMSASLLCGGAAWQAGAALVALGVALTVALGVGEKALAAPNAAALLRAPLASVRALVYPLGGLVLVACALDVEAAQAGAQEALAVAGYFLGLGAWKCAASTYRRTPQESPGARLGLFLPAALLCGVAPWLGARTAALFLAAAAVCAALIYTAGTRTWLAALALSCSCALLWTPWPWTAGAAALVTALTLAGDFRLCWLRRRARQGRRVA